jgi:hypothetical protein
MSSIPFGISYVLVVYDKHAPAFAQPLRCETHFEGGGPSSPFQPNDRQEACALKNHVQKTSVPGSVSQHQASFQVESSA